jgi:hypothetical protein
LKTRCRGGHFDLYPCCVNRIAHPRPIHLFQTWFFSKVLATIGNNAAVSVPPEQCRSYLVLHKGWSCAQTC